MTNRLEAKRKYTPLSQEEDGVRFIWVNIKASTPLGRFLCPMAKAPWTHPEYGRFASVSGFHQWLRCGKDDRLRTLYGAIAIKTGNSIYKEKHGYSDFYALDMEYLRATLYKIQQYNTLESMPGNRSVVGCMLENNLPYKVVSMHSRDNMLPSGDALVHSGLTKQTDILNDIATNIKSFGKCMDDVTIVENFSQIVDSIIPKSR